MKANLKILDYTIPSVFCATIIILLSVGYALFEYGMGAARGVAAPIGVCLCLCVFYVGQMVLIRFDKYAAAGAVALIKYLLLSLGIGFVFHNFFSGLYFMVLISFVIPVVGVGIMISVFLGYPVILITLIVLHIAIMSEPIFIFVRRKKIPRKIIKNKK